VELFTKVAPPLARVKAPPLEEAVATPAPLVSQVMVVDRRDPREASKGSKVKVLGGP
jgi:hypothetical protein